MKVKDIIEVLSTMSPESIACKWDNVGLIVGSEEKNVYKVLVALDVKSSTVDYAIENNVDLIVSHHPMIFSAIKKIREDDFIGSKLIKLIKNDISVYTLHTNFDKEGSMGNLVAEGLWLNNIEPLATAENDDKGLGIIGDYSPINLKSFSFVVKDSFDIANLKVYGDLTRMVKKVAMVAGSGADFVDLAIEKGADVLITGDVTHHKGLDAMEKGLMVIDAGHYGLEKLFIDFISKLLKLKFEDIDIISEERKETFTWI